LLWCRDAYAYMCTCTCDGVRCCLSLIGLALCPSFSQEHGPFTISGQQLGRLTEGTTVTIRCNRGYSPIDDIREVTCSSEGVWSPNIPKCAGICTDWLCEYRTYTWCRVHDCEGLSVTGTYVHVYVQRPYMYKYGLPNDKACPFSRLSLM